MCVKIDISDRLYDYTDEEKAQDAIARYQNESGLSDESVVAIWNAKDAPHYNEIERLIFESVAENGSAKRAQESIPFGISLFIETEEAHV